MSRRVVLSAAAGGALALLVFLAFFFWPKKKPAPPPAPPKQVEVQPAPAPPVCAPQNYIVGRGDSLWRIAKRVWGGRSYFWPVLAETNADKIKNPNLIRPGWVLTIPCLCDLPPLSKKPVMAKAAPKRHVRHSVKPVKKKMAAQETAHPLALPFQPVSAAMLEMPPQVSPALSFTEGEGKNLSWQASANPPPQTGATDAEPRAENLTQQTLFEEKKRRGMTSKLLLPFKAVAWPFHNPRKASRFGLAYAGAALGLLPIPQARVAGFGAVTTSVFLAPGASSAQFYVASSVSESGNGFPLTGAEVESTGRIPYLRYSLPPGGLNWVSNSVFQQPPYNPDNKAAIEALPRDLAASLGLAGTAVYVEFPGQAAAEVVLSDKAVVIYQAAPQGPVPLYLADCRYKGKPWANRLKLISPPSAPAAPPTTQVVVQPAAPQITNNMNIPPFPSSVNLNLTGLPAPPTATSQHSVYEIKRDKFQKMESVGKTVMYSGVGVGVAALGLKLPEVIENIGRVQAAATIQSANRSIAVAKITSQGRVDAAKNRVPDQVFVTTTGVNNPSVSNSNTYSPSVSATGGQGGDASIRDSGNSSSKSSSAPPPRPPVSRVPKKDP